MHIIRFLTLQEIVQVHIVQIELFGGMQGIRDQGLLESAVYAPQATFNGQYLHEDIFSMAAAYTYGIIKNHPFIDGNKRTGIESVLLFLHYNEYELDVTPDELYKLAISIATSKITSDTVATYFRKKNACH